jgi:hypothetical protein
MNATSSSKSVSRLKLGLHTTVNNEWSDAPGYAYLEIGAEQAQAILDLIGLTKVFREQAGNSELICPHYAICFGSGIKVPDFRLIEIPFVEGEEPDSNRPVVLLPVKFDADATAPETEHRVECHRIEVDDEQVRFTALSRHGSDEFTTADIGSALLQAVADGRETGLPLAALTPAESSTVNLN